MLYVKLVIYSIHSFIHHHLYPNTAREIQTQNDLSRLLHVDATLLLVAYYYYYYYQPRICHPPQDIHTACANMSSTWSWWSALFIHASIIITWIEIQRKIYGLLLLLLNGPQATASRWWWWCSPPPGSMPTINEQLTHSSSSSSIHSTNANMYSAWAVGLLLYSFMHSASLVFKYRQRHGPNSLQATTCAHCSTPTNSDRHTQQYS